MDILKLSVCIASCKGITLVSKGLSAMATRQLCFVFLPHQPESSGGSALALAIAGAASASKLGVSLGVPVPRRGSRRGSRRVGYVSMTGNNKVAVRADLV